MLIEFSVENFRSFKERMTLSMVANDSEELLHSNTASVGKKLRLLKSLAIYGANASGKSNLVKALEFMGRLMISSAKDTQTGEKIRFEPFLLNTSEWKKPSLFEIIFLVNKTRYRYGFQINESIIVSEWLFQQQNNTEKKLFTREGNTFTLSTSFREAKGLEQRTRDNALFLSVLAQFNILIGKTILQQVQNFSIFNDVVFDRIIANLSTQLLDNTTQIEAFLSNFNLGFTEISIQNRTLKELTPKTGSKEFDDFIETINTQVSKQRNSFPEFLTKHQVLDSNNLGIQTIDFSLEKQESEGTKKIVAFAYTFIQALQQGLCIVFDEIDNSLHPILSRKIIELFNNSETNPNGAQLIFTTHDTNLLSRKLLRRDQIWFTEKMPHGATDLYSLADFEIDEKQSVESTSYSDDYLLGKYGAIPYIGDVAALLEGRKHE